MSIQKRRIIYMTDEDWARLLAQAASSDTTVSAIVRAATAAKVKPTLQPLASPRPAPKVAARSR